MPSITIRSGLLSGRTFQLDRAVVIGRGATADVSLDDPGVSRRHARIGRAADGWVLEDLGSANGTTLNGRRVSGAVTIHDGDIIGIAGVLVFFSERGGTGEQPAVQYVEGPEPAVLISMSGREADSTADEAARLRLLDDIARIGDLVFDEPALVAFIAEELLTLVPRADRAVVLTNGDGGLVPRAARTRTGRPETDIVVSRRLLDDVMSRREAVLAIDTMADTRYAESESIVALGIRAAICAPMMFQGEIYGVVQVDTASAGMPFREPDVALVLSLASQLGMALGYARLHAALVARELLEHDIALARRIQEQFLPERRLVIPGYAVAVDYRPALEVSGDFYDLIELDRRRLALVVGDVSGKGVSAALYASTLTTHLRYQAQGQSDPGAILARTNGVLAGRSREGMFATVAVAVLEPSTGVVEVASAGHPPPYVRRADGRTEQAPAAGTVPIGLDPGAVYPGIRVELGAGDALVLCTDGVIEALDAQQRLFGEERAAEAIRSAAADSVDGIVQALGRAIERFVGGVAQSDDITVVGLRRDA